MDAGRLKTISEKAAKFFRSLPRAVTAPLAVFVPAGMTAALAVVLAGLATDGHATFGNPLWSIFGDSLAVLIVFLAALCFRSRWCAALAAVLACVNLLLRILALVLYHQAFMSTDYRDLRLIWMHTDGPAIRAFLGPGYGWWLTPAVIAALAAVALLAFAAWRNLRALGRRTLTAWRIFTGAMLLLSIAAIWWFRFTETKAISSFYTGHLVRPLPVQAAYFFRDAFRGKRRGTAVPLSGESRRILESLDVIPRQGEPRPPRPARFDRIVIVAVESLDLAYIRGANPAMPEGVTPNLDRLMNEYPAMRNYFCSSQPTSWGLTGILMSRFDYEREQEGAEKNPSLFTVAAKQGYATCYFSPISGVFAENRRIYSEVFAPDRQFFLEDWMRKYGMRHSFAWGMSDRELYSCVLKEMRSWNEERFVVLVSTMDTHPPYIADGISEEDKKRFPTPFLQSLHMIDRHLGDFLKEFMADEKLWNDRTLIVVTADHTATQGENYLKREELVPERIPLIFIAKDKTVFADLDTGKYASSIDLAPTLVNLIGGSVPDSFMGRDLFGKKNLAISWIMSYVLLVRSPGRDLRIPIEQRCSDSEQQAFADFFRSNY